MSKREYLLTTEGAAKLREELATLRGPRRDEIAARLRNAVQTIGHYPCTLQEQGRESCGMAQVEDRHLFEQHVVHRAPHIVGVAQTPHHVVQPDGTGVHHAKRGVGLPTRA